MAVERKKILDKIDQISTEERSLWAGILNDPPGWSRHYQEVREYIIQKYSEQNDGSKKLLNFHFTPGDNFMNVTKEEMWEHMQKIDREIKLGNCVVSDTPPTSGRKPVDLKEWVKNV